MADVVSELQYQNEEENPVEVTFVFPLDDEAAVYAFEGLIGGTRIEAEIREKKQVQKTNISEYRGIVLGRHKRLYHCTQIVSRNLHITVCYAKQT